MQMLAAKNLESVQEKILEQHNAIANAINMHKLGVENVLNAAIIAHQKCTLHEHPEHLRIHNAFFGFLSNPANTATLKIAQ